MTKNLCVILGSVTLLLGAALPMRVEAQSYRELAAAPSADRGLDVFAIDSEGSVDHRFQRESGDFAGYEALGSTATDIAALELAGGRHEVYTVDADQVLWRTRQEPDTGSWTPPEPLDNATQQVSVARSLNGRVELFEIGSDSALWHIGRDGDDGELGPWQRVDFAGTKLAAAAADGDGFVVAVIAADRSLWLLSFAESGELRGEPVSLAGESFDIALARFPGGGHSLVAVGTNNDLWERRRGADQDFSDWQYVGRAAQRVALTAGPVSGEGVELFTIEASGAISHSQLSAADAEWSRPESLVAQSRPLVSELKGRARLIIPSLDVDKDVDVSIGLRFGEDRTSAEITSFPSVVTEPFDTPFGTTTSTVSLARSSTGEINRGDGSLRLPVTLHFDQSLDLPIIQEDGDLTVDLSTDADGGQRIDPATGNVALSGSGRFQGQGSTNPLDGQDAQIIVSGTLTPVP